MAVHYYLSVFPVEALIASELSPTQFGAYMATGSKKGSAEQIIFIELTKEFGSDFDWNYAKEACVPHPDGEPKHSVYLAIYRVLEHVPFDAFGIMYLTTRDGRSLALKQNENVSIEHENEFNVYQELCPVTPVIVSKLHPNEFGITLTNKKNKIQVPKIIFTDLKKIDPEGGSHTGHIGSLYAKKEQHYQACVDAVLTGEAKTNKTMDRSCVESFSFNMIDTSIFASDGTKLLVYPLPGIEEIKKIDYDWGRSAQIF